jgi:hypothetical protein
MTTAGVQPVAAEAIGAWNRGNGSPTPGVNGSRALAALLAVGRRPEAGDPELVRQAAAGTVSQLFFAPLLAEVRKLPFGRTFATGGRTEEIFGEQLDLRIADSVAANCGGLTRQLAECLTIKARSVSDGSEGTCSGAPADEPPVTPPNQLAVCT